MNKLKTLLLSITLILTNQLLAGTALNGDYTIGGISPDYVSITDAVSDLNTDGTTGPVNFIIRDGSYNEQVTITAFTRSTATDLVTFSAEGNSVNWLNSSVGIGSEWVLKLEGASYINISDLSFNSVIPGFGDLVYFEGGSNNITIERCLFDGQVGIGTLILQNTVGSHANNHFYFNTFSQGDIAIDFDYQFGGADSAGLEINDNTFTNQTSRSVETGSGNLVINRNTISAGTISNSDYIGFIIDDNSPTIENNTFDMTKGRAAIWAIGGGIAVESRIVNNMIALRYTNAITAGIYVGGQNVSIYHNTVRSASATAPAVLIAGSSVDVRLQNNIIVNDAGNLALQIIDASSISISNHNNIYSTGNPVIFWDGTSYNSLFSYNQASGLDNNSIEQATSFVNTAGFNDLHLASPNNNDVDFLAPILATVNTDFDGDTRGTYSAYKGADEGVAILPLDNADVGGFYTVGGTTPDYTTVNAAIIDLKQRGMKGPVTFRIRSGSYTTNQTLTGVTRSGNADDLLIFRANDFGNPPTIRYNATNDSNNWVIRIQDMSYIGFNHVNFLTTSANIYGQLLVFEGDTDNIIVRDSIFTGVTGQTADESSLVSATDAGLDDYEFSNNQFINGSIALNFITSNPFTQPRGSVLVVESNTFSQQSVNALVSNHNNIDFNENDVSSTLNDVDSLSIVFNLDTQIGKNKFLLSGTNTTAINFRGADGSSFATPGIISNNFIKASNGIDLNTGSNTIYMYYNTIVASVLPINVQANVNESTALQLVNNILFNNGSGAAIFIAENAVVDESNYNNFINGSGTLIDWQGSQYITLADFQAATVFDDRSTTTIMSFVSLINADFHLTLSSIANTELTGTPLTFVVDDYDSDTRTAVSPYMGADQVAGTPIINTYSVGGTISGLVSGNTIDIQNSNGDSLSNRTNGGFTFPIHQNDGGMYAVTVVQDPSNPNQTCGITNPSGSIEGDDITDVEITCVLISYSIGGTISGLTGSNPVIIQNNNGDDLELDSNGDFTFNTPINDNDPYNVLVLMNPTNPNQLCGITNGSNNVSGVNVDNVTVICVTQTYSIGGTLTGLEASNTLELQNNSGNNLIINQNGVFTFTTELDSNGSYAVTVLNQPNNPIQDCQVSSGNGDVSNADINSISINCITSDIIFKNDFESMVVHFSLPTDNNINTSTNSVALGGGVSPQVIPSVNFYGLFLMMVLFLVIARRKVNN